MCVCVCLCTKASTMSEAKQTNKQVNKHTAGRSDPAEEPNELQSGALRNWVYGK